jgi:hypothetical protein
MKKALLSKIHEAFISVAPVTAIVQPSLYAARAADMVGADSFRGERLAYRGGDRTLQSRSGFGNDAYGPSRW